MMTEAISSRECQLFHDLAQSLAHRRVVIRLVQQNRLLPFFPAKLSFLFSLVLFAMTRTSRGRQKIEMKLIESKEDKYVAFSKRKLSLFGKAYELSVLTGAHVGVVLTSPSGKVYAFGSPCIDEIIDKFRNWNLDDFEDHLPDTVASSLIQEFGDLCRELEAEKQKVRVGSQLSFDKQKLEQFVAIKLHLDEIRVKIKKESQKLKTAVSKMIDLNADADPDEGEASGTYKFM